MRTFGDRQRSLTQSEAARLISSLRNDLRKSLICLARPRRFELLTFAFGGQRSNSYNKIPLLILPGSTSGLCIPR
jgi:hypothetical protein